MQYVEFKDIAIGPFGDPFSETATGGPRFPSGSPDFVHNQRGAQIFRAHAPAYDGVLPRLRGRYLYAGYLYTHFGHFLSESVHRLWLAREPEFRGLPALFVGTAAPASFAPWMLDALRRFFDVTNVATVNEPHIVESLVVAESGKTLGTLHKPWYAAKIMARGHHVSEPPAPAPERVFVTRAHFGSARLLGEPIIETALSQAGYFILRPEDHSLDYQIRVYRHARWLVFSEGSAIHLLEHLPPSDGRIAILCRRRSGAWMAKHALAALGHNFTVFNTVLPLPPIAADPNHRSLGLALPQAVLDFLRANGFLDAIPDLPADIDRELRIDLQQLVRQRLRRQAPAVVEAECNRLLSGALASIPPGFEIEPAAEDVLCLARRLLGEIPTTLATPPKIA